MTAVMVLCNESWFKSPNMTTPLSTDTTLGCTYDEDSKNYIPYIIEAYIQPWIFSLGFITNILSFSVLCYMSIVPSLKTALLALCVSDSLASIFGFTYILLETAVFQGDLEFGVWIPGAVQVFTMYKIYLLFTGYSSLLIKTGSIIKTHALMNPLVARIKVNRGFTVKLVIVMFAGTVGLFVPLVLYILWKVCFRDQTTQICHQFNNTMPNAIQIKYYFFILAMIMGPGTIVANISCFILLKRAIRKSKKSVLQSPDNSCTVTKNYKIRQAKQGKRINKTFLYSLIVHTLCILPSCVQIVCLVIDPIKLVFDEDNMVVKIIDLVAEISLAILPCYNFWLYLVVNKDFRRTFRLVYTCKLKQLLSKEKGFHGNTLFSMPSIEAGLDQVVAAGEPEIPRKRKSVRFSEVVEDIDYLKELNSNY